MKNQSSKSRELQSLERDSVALGHGEPPAFAREPEIEPAPGPPHWPPGEAETMLGLIAQLPWPGSPFGAARKSAWLASASAILDRLYPGP